MADTFSKGGDGDAGESLGHRELGADKESHHELAAELGGGSDVVDSFAGDPGHEHFSNAEIGRQMGNHRAPSEGIGEASDGFERDGQSKAPADEADIGEDFAKAEAAEEPDVKAQGEEQDQRFDSAH